jgi:hypothetical protein
VVIGDQLVLDPPHNTCEECKGTGKRHEHGKPMLPYRHCKACLGKGALQLVGRDEKRDA